MKKNRKKIGKFVFIALIVLVLAYLYFFGNHGYFALVRMENKADSLRALEDSLETNLQQLQERLELLEKNDPEIIEEEARRLGLAGENEGMIIIQVDSSDFSE